MKKFLNEPARAVDDAVAGFVAAHADLVRLDADHRVVLRRDPLPVGQVALVSGGGSGHEPLHAGFVGDGMLAGAVLGDVFASPTTDQVLAAAQSVDAGAGVLLIIKNYTGDVLNFRLAAELGEDVDVEIRSVVVDDDVAVGNRGDRPGRRGTGAVVFVEKILGARAAQRAGLDELVQLGERVVNASRSIGVALTSCTTPMAGRPTFDLGTDEAEFGVGIHGEAGARRVPMASSAQFARDMVAALLAEVPTGCRSVLVFTHGFGGTPPGEWYTLPGDVVRAFADAGLSVDRHLVGSLVTSLDMAGASVSVLALDAELTALWDAPVRTSAMVHA